MLRVKNQGSGPRWYVRERVAVDGERRMVEAGIGPAWLVPLDDPRGKGNGKVFGQWVERAGRPEEGMLRERDALALADEAIRGRVQAMEDRKAAQEEQERQEALGAAHGDLTMGTLAEVFVTFMSDDPDYGWRHGWANNAATYCRRLAREVGEDVQVSEVSSARLRSVLAGLRPMRGGKPIEGKDRMSPKTMRHYTLALRQMLDHAVRLGWIAVSPAAGDLLKPEGEVRRKRVKLGDEQDELRDDQYLELDAVWEVMDCLREGSYTAHPRRHVMVRDPLMVGLMAMCGLRPEEVLALRFGDFDWQAERVNVRRAYTQGQMGPTKNGKPRSIPMPGELVALMPKATIAPDRLAFFRSDDLAKPASLDSLRERFKRAQDHVGVQRRELRQLRHTYAVTLARASVPEDTIRQLLGHEDPSTSRIYTRFMPDARDLAAGAFARR